MMGDETRAMDDQPIDNPELEDAEPADASQSTTPVEAGSPVAASPSWNRRTLLRAAALGAAALGALGKIDLAVAHIQTNVNCTANDVRIIGPGIVINEPCNCTGTFNAQVTFQINNNTGTNRYCVTAHLCDGRNAAGQIVFPARDILIGTVTPGTNNYTVTIPGYPCNAGLVCFGAAGSLADGGFDKGETCPTGQCCTVISWEPNDGTCLPNQDYIKSKCRAQQVCIRGRGATLSCISNCTPTCGGVVTLRLAVSGGVAPYTFAIAGQTFGPTNDTSHDFQVTVTQTTSFTGTVTDSSSPSCAQQSNTVTLNVTPLATPTLSLTGPNCAGSVTLTASPAGLANYTFKEGATVLLSGTSNVLTQTFAAGSHSVTVTARNSAGCEATSAPVNFTVNPPVTLAMGNPTQADCTGVLTFTATAGGGTGTYTFTFKDENGATITSGISGSGNTRTLTRGPLLDGICHAVVVSVVDSAGCPSTPATVKQTFSQCVVTTQNCGTE